MTEKLTLPPSSVATEENVLGSVLMDPGSFARLRTITTEDDFYIVRHGWIWAVMCGLADAGEPIDTRTVSEGLRVKPDPTGKHDNLLEAIGGEAYLAYLPSNVPTALHSEIYAKIVWRAAIKRKLIGLGGQLAQLAYDEEKPLEKLIPEAQALVDGVISQWHEAGTGPRHISESLTAFYDGTNAGPKIDTGLKALNHRLQGGWRGGRFYLVAGRPGMGKTLTLIFEALKAAIAGNRTLVVTLEMVEAECIMRLLSMYTGFDFETIEAELEKQPADKSPDVVSALAELNDLPLFFSETATTPARLRAAIEDVKADIVFVDRIGLMQAGVSSRDRNSDRERLNYISRHMKIYANTLQIPFVVAAQLNRECEKRNDKRPLLGDLKESGNLEQDADAVVMLYRHSLYYKGTGDGYIEVLVRKSRQGKVGESLLLVDLAAMRLQDTTIAQKNLYRAELGQA